jgi:hypothetical protein
MQSKPILAQSAAAQLIAIGVTAGLQPPAATQIPPPVARSNSST